MTLKLKALSATAAVDGAWNIASAVYNGSPINWFNVSEQVITSSSLFFKDDGTKMYVLESVNDDVLEYSLSTAWDISTASYVRLFTVIGQETSPTGLFFKSDGTKMYIVGSAGDDVNEYSLSTAWNISTASYVQNKSVSAQDTTPSGIFFKPDGTKMYVVGDAGNEVNEYDLSTAWDISTASYVQVFSVLAQDTSPVEVFFKPDGTTMYVLGASGDDVNEYSLSTAWDISTASYVQNKSVSAQASSPTGLFFKDDGTKMYIVDSPGTDPRVVFSYDLSSAWDISTASFTYPTTNYFRVIAQETAPTGLFFKDDGTKMYVVGATGDDVNEYSLSTAWDITTSSYVQNFSVAAQDLTPQDIFFKDDGTKMYILGSTGDDVNEYNLSTAWNISTASYVQNFSVVTEESTPLGLFFKLDGTKMYVIGAAGDDVNEYSLSTAWNISTASYVQNFSVATEDTGPVGIFFKDDGTKMYIVGTGGDAVYEYDLSTAWDISTASYVQNFSVATQETTPTGLFFKDDGTKMYIVGNSGDAIFAYDL